MLKYFACFIVKRSLVKKSQRAKLFAKKCHLVWGLDRVTRTREAGRLSRLMINWKAQMKCWEVIAHNLSKAGWSWGCVSAVNCNGRTIFVADAHRGNGRRFVVRADEKLTAFLELESAIRSKSSSRSESR